MHTWIGRSCYRDVGLGPMAPCAVKIGLAGAGAGLAVVAAAGVAAQRRLARAIAEDPSNAELRDPPRGRARSGALGRRHRAARRGLRRRRTVPPSCSLHGWTEAIAYWTS